MAEGESNVPDAIETAVAAVLDAQGLVQAGDAVVVAVSGGSDSIALLSILNRLAQQSERGYTLTAAHLDHAIRPTSESDARFVASAADAMGIAFVSGRADARKRASQTGESLESAARELRYAFLGETADSVHAKAVALGHHADDNVETVLHRIARGTGLRGMAGIPSERPLPGSEAWVIRPLIRLRHQRLLDYCHRHDLTFLTDETNDDTAYTRNFIRHEVLPLLRDRINPQADQAILRLVSAAREAELYLSNRAMQALEKACVVRKATMLVLDRRALRMRSALIQKYALRIALEFLGVPMGQFGSDHLHALSAMLAGKGKGIENLPGHYSARRQGPSLVIEYFGRSGSGQQPNHDPVSVACPGRTVLPDGAVISTRLDPADALAFQAHCRDNQLGLELLDAANVHGRLLCRARKNGDRFVPLGAPGTQTVSDLLTNLKSPGPQRDNTWLLCDEEGILYVAPYRIADRAKVTPETRQYLRIEFTPPTPSDS